MAGAGIGKIILVDHDLISFSSLNRLILFREVDIGEKKSFIAIRELAKTNIEIIHHSHRLSQSGSEEFVDDATIVIDATDNFITRYVLSDYCFCLS